MDTSPFQSAPDLSETDTIATRRNFDAALAPIRQGFVESGATEEELTALLEEGLRAVRSAR